MRQDEHLSHFDLDEELGDVLQAATISPANDSLARASRWVGLIAAVGCLTWAAMLA